MKCKLFFFNGKNVDYEKIAKHFENLSDSFRIITNSAGLNCSLKTMEKNSFLLSDIFPEEGPLANEVYLNSKKIQSEYKKIFSGIETKQIEIFSGFDFLLLRQFSLLVKSKKILENKQDSIFIIENFLINYLGIPKLALDLGYDIEEKIGFISKSNIKYLNLKDKNEMASYANKSSLQKITKVISTSSEKTISISKLKMIIRFVFRAASYFSNVLTYKIRSNIYQNSSKVILNNVNKKILNSNSGYDAKCAFFVTTVREDLFLKPWYPLLKKFEQEHIPFQIFTSDLATSLILSKEKISFVNLFEEVKVLTKIIKNGLEGKKIRDVVNRRVSGNQSVSGFNVLLDEFFEMAYRSYAIIIILDFIINKMKLNSIVAVADGEMLENLASTFSRKKKIPSFAILPGAGDPLPFLSDWFHADKIFVHGIDGLDTMLAMNYEKNRIIVTGNPKYDFMMKVSTKNSKNLLHKKYGIEKDCKLLVVGMSRWHQKDEIWMSNLIKFCNKNNFRIVIKIHPIYKTAQHEKSGQKIDFIKKSCRIFKYLITYDVELDILLSAADLVITDYSNLGIESLLLEKPLLIVNFTNEDYEDYESFNREGASTYIDDYNKLENIVKEILEGKDYLIKLREAYKKVSKRYNYLNDGKASDRIFNLLTITSRRNDSNISGS